MLLSYKDFVKYVHKNWPTYATPDNEVNVFDRDWDWLFGISCEWVKLLFNPYGKSNISTYNNFSRDASNRDDEDYLFVEKWWYADWDVMFDVDLKINNDIDFYAKYL
jgi:hypothetical protein